ncbi:hypothetical protein PHLH8_47350 [Pseudomonas sp. Pc102]|uniref:diguanylate cyclase domain-containing protein n=1 Tax=Pseudomonas sp. Pc102 TaxID=2678261 RepID=UPI001BCE5608|nr:diguanylate cyclase [Pseudomonas sp. Pc102]BBP85093.1 hypothetical protein PHLH8_47350 [Pseudomonas sp. Pc102]
MRMGLTVKLSILLACIGILSSGITGYFSYSANQALLVKEAEGNLLTSTELLGQRLSSLLSDIDADALTLADMPSSALVASLGSLPGDTGAKPHLAGVFATVMRLHPQYSQVRLISRQNHGIEVIRFDRDGQRMIEVDGLLLQEKGHFPYVFETLLLKPGQVYLAPITVNHERGAHSADGAPTLRVATPVAGKDGVVQGVVVINVDLKRFLEQLEADLPQGHQLYLANQWGDFLVHPVPAMAFGFDKGRRILIQDSFADTQQLLSRQAPSVLVNGLDAPTRAEGKIMAFVRKPFGLNGEDQFVVLGLSRPLEDVLGSGRSLGRSIIQMVLVFSVLALVLAVLFSRALTRPLQMLSHAARSFQTEHMHDVALPIARKDEIGVLARGFDLMRRELKSHMEMMSRNQQELRHLADHDSLTDLPNRRQFFQQLQRAICTVGEGGDELAVLFIDLDDFKKINDDMGHSVGDEVLIVVARRLRGAVRSGDLVARLGGDEFVVLIQGEDIAAAAKAVVNKILTALADPITVKGRPLEIGASIGLSIYPQDGTTAEALMLHADNAMYRTKLEGRKVRAGAAPE